MRTNQNDTTKPAPHAPPRASLPVDSAHMCMLRAGNGLAPRAAKEIKWRHWSAPNTQLFFLCHQKQQKAKGGPPRGRRLPPPRRVCTRDFLTSAHALSDGWATPKEASKQQVSTWSVHALVSHNQPNRISQSINQPMAPPIDRSRTRNPKFKSLNQLL